MKDNNGGLKPLKIKTDNPKEILRKINLLLSDYLPEIYRYNNLVRDRNYYLKPVHIVIKKRSDGNIVKYHYYGRYWYRIERRRDKPGSSRIKWIYLGREKPEKNLPDPPSNPLEGLVIKITDNELEVVASRNEIYRLIYRVLTSSQHPLIESQAR